LPGELRQAHRAWNQPFRHERDDEDENDAQRHVPALQISAHHVLHDHHDAGADDRPEQGRGAAGDHHQQRLGRGLQLRCLGAYEVGVVDEQQAGDAAPEAREQEGHEADQPDIVAERVHPSRLIAGAAQARAERRAHEQRHRDNGGQKYDKRRKIKGRRAGEADAERCRPA
jgi:hypothetical protein